MKIEDIDKEFREMRECLANADAALAERKYDQAQQDYERALVLLTRAYPPEHPDVLKCMQNLSDAYAAQRNHKKTIEILKKLLSVLEKKQSGDKSDVVVTLAKLAKAHEKQNQLREANSYYKQAITHATQTLFRGHPLMMSVQESYARMLRRMQRIDEATEIEEELRAIRLRGTDAAERYLHDLGDDEEEAVASEQAEEGGGISSLREAEAQGTGLRGTFDANKSLIAVIAGGGVLLAFFAFLFTTLWHGGSDTGRREGVVHVDYAGRIFISPAGDCSVRFVDDKTAQISLGAQQYNVPYETQIVAAGAALDEMQDKGVVTMVATPLGMRLGTFDLFVDGAAELRLCDRMRRLSAAAQRCFQSTSEYPQDKDTLRMLEPNLFRSGAANNDNDVRVMYVGRLGSDQDDSIEKSLQAGGLIRGEPALDTGITCYYTLSGSATSGLRASQFFLRGRDRYGNFIKTGAKDIYAICLMNGRDCTSQTAPSDLKPTKVKVIIENGGK